MKTKKPDYSDKPDQVNDANDTGKKQSLLVWNLILLVYLVLLVCTGYIAFWEQDFNKPEYALGKYINMLDDYKKLPPEEHILSQEELSQIIQAAMKTYVDDAGELQELACQSFYLVLGAVLAFISGSISKFFHNMNSGP